jgi:hypothetical protein
MFQSLVSRKDETCGGKYGVDGGLGARSASGHGAVPRERRPGTARRWRRNDKRPAKTRAGDGLELNDTAVAAVASGTGSCPSQAPSDARVRFRVMAACGKRITHATELECPGSRTGLGQVAGVSNPEISDLTHKQPQPHRHDREDSVPGGDFFIAMGCDSFAIMKSRLAEYPGGYLSQGCRLVRASHASPARHSRTVIKLP